MAQTDKTNGSVNWRERKDSRNRCLASSALHSLKCEFKIRRYFHFDEPIGINRSRLIATNPELVKKWAFMPMLKFVSETEKRKRLADGQFDYTTKQRPICYSSHKDAAIYTYYGHILSEKYEKQLKERNLEEAITAFRPSSGKCNIHFAKEAFDYIKSKENCVVLAFDVEGFFDSLDHKLLKEKWAFILNTKTLPDDHYAVFKSLTRFSFVLRDKVFKLLGISKHNPHANKRRRICTPEEFRAKVRKAGLIESNSSGKGIPQGSPMSAILSNIYMLEFDTVVQKKMDSVGGFYRRYCDDMLCIVPIDKVKEVKSFISDEIQKVRLDFNEDKTTQHIFETKEGILSTDKQLQYLGFLFNGKRVLLRIGGVSRFYSRMRSSVRLAVLTKIKTDKQLALKQPIKRKKLNIQYSYLGHRNFISYALRAAKELKSTSIKRQIRRHWRKLNEQVAKAETALSGT